MYEHGVETYPAECVGVVTGIPGEPETYEIQRLTNKQNEMHEKDPEHFGRDATTGYFVDPKEVFDLIRETEAKGRKLLVLYHSHPNHDAYFSDEDHNAAVMWDEPVFPGTDYLVVSVYDGKVKEASIFSWDGEKFPETVKLPIAF